MKLKNVTIATAILAVLTGCGSSGGGSSTPNTNQPTAQNEQARQQVPDAKKAEETRKAEEASKVEETRKAEETRKSEETKTTQSKAEFAEWLKQYDIHNPDYDFIDKNFDKSKDEKLVAVINYKKRNDSLTREFDLNELAQYEIVNKAFPQIENSDSKTDRSAKVYNQKYSIIYGLYVKNTYDSYSRGIDESFGAGTSTDIDDYSYGLRTKETGLPTEGQATYTGKAFNYESNGDVIYHVDFEKRKGSGKITGIQNYGDITLSEADIKVKSQTREVGIPSGVASSAIANEQYGSYTVNFYGPKAEEINGNVYFGFSHGSSKPSLGQFNSTTIGFGGTRGEITK